MSMVALMKEKEIGNTAGPVPNSSYICSLVSLHMNSPFLRINHRTTPSFSGSGYPSSSRYHSISGRIQLSGSGLPNIVGISVYFLHFCRFRLYLHPCHPHICVDTLGAVRFHHHRAWCTLLTITKLRFR